MKEYIKRAPSFRKSQQVNTEVCEMTAGQAIGEIVLQKNAPVVDIQATLKGLFDIVNMSATDDPVILVTAYHGYNLRFHTDTLRNICRWIHSGNITYCNSENIIRFKFSDGILCCVQGKIFWRS